MPFSACLRGACLSSVKFSPIFFASHLGRIFPGWKIRTDAVIDSPAEGLLRKADSWKPDLIVLGCHGRTALGGLFMGSVSQKVLHHAHADVRISRLRQGAGNKAPKVLVAVDGSAGSDPRE